MEHPYGLLVDLEYPADHPTVLDAPGLITALAEDREGKEFARAQELHCGLPPMAQVNMIQ